MLVSNKSEYYMKHEVYEGVSSVAVKNKLYYKRYR